MIARAPEETSTFVDKLFIIIADASAFKSDQL